MKNVNVIKREFPWQEVWRLKLIKNIF